MSAVVRVVARTGLLMGIAAIAALIGHFRSPEAGPFGVPRTIASAENQRLEGVAATTFADVTWLLGNADQVRHSVQTALARVPQGDGATRARLFVRLAMLTPSTDGQGALLHSACQADPDSCDDLFAVASAQAKQRAVTPGKSVPLSLIKGHPPITP